MAAIKAASPASASLRPPPSKGLTRQKFKQRNNPEERAKSGKALPPMFIDPNTDHRPPSLVYTRHNNAAEHDTYLDSYSTGRFHKLEREAIDRAVDIYLDEHGIPRSDLPRLLRRKTKAGDANPYADRKYENWIKNITRISKVNRTLLQTQIFMKRAYNDTLVVEPRTRWTDEDDERLLELLLLKGPKWEEIDRAMGRDNTRQRVRVIEARRARRKLEAATEVEFDPTVPACGPYPPKKTEKIAACMLEVMTREGYQKASQISEWTEIATKAVNARTPEKIDLCRRFCMTSIFDPMAGAGKKLMKWTAKEERELLSGLRTSYPEAESDEDVPWSSLASGRWKHLPPKFLRQRCRIAIDRAGKGLAFQEGIRLAVKAVPDTLPSMQKILRRDGMAVLDMIATLGCPNFQSIPWDDLLKEFVVYLKESLVHRLRGDLARVEGAEGLGFLESVKRARYLAPLDEVEATAGPISSQFLENSDSDGGNELISDSDTGDESSPKRTVTPLIPPKRVPVPRKPKSATSSRENSLPVVARDPNDEDEVSAAAELSKLALSSNKSSTSEARSIANKRVKPVAGRSTKVSAAVVRAESSDDDDDDSSESDGEKLTFAALVPETKMSTRVTKPSISKTLLKAAPGVSTSTGSANAKSMLPEASPSTLSAAVVRAESSDNDDSSDDDEQNPKPAADAPQVRKLMLAATPPQPKKSLGKKVPPVTTVSVANISTRSISAQPASVPEREETTDETDSSDDDGEEKISFATLLTPPKKPATALLAPTITRPLSLQRPVTTNLPAKTKTSAPPAAKAIAPLHGNGSALSSNPSSTPSNLSNTHLLTNSHGTPSTSTASLKLGKRKVDTASHEAVQGGRGHSAKRKRKDEPVNVSRIAGNHTMSDDLSNVFADSTPVEGIRPATGSLHLDIDRTNIEKKGTKRKKREEARERQQSAGTSTVEDTGATSTKKRKMREEEPQAIHPPASDGTSAQSKMKAKIREEQPMTAAAATLTDHSTDNDSKKKRKKKPTADVGNVVPARPTKVSTSPVVERTVPAAFESPTVQPAVVLTAEQRKEKKRKAQKRLKVNRKARRAAAAAATSSDK
ncbi:hypothetical protein HKX48_006057 [Thoreauomyces humboldtii]|nr:hypothetical protein HKX48_006057 [Thoreauomyces humboldtii]